MLNRFRAFWTKVITPIAKLLLRLGVSPDAVTLVGTLGVAFGALFFFPRGDLLVGVLFITAFVFSDLVDGTMARMSGSSSKWGAFLDSTLDRLGDAAIFDGLTMYYVGPGENDRLVAILVMTGLAALFDVPVLIPITLGLLAVASTITVVQRILTVRRQALAAT